MSGGVHWNALLGNSPDPGRAFLDAFNKAQERKRQQAIEAEDMAWKREQRGQQRSEWQRETDAREGMAGMILTPSSGPQVNALMTAPTGSVANPAQPTADVGARERLIRADPEKFLSFEGKRLDLTDQQLKSYRDLNNMAMQLLGGVHDQATYDAAKQRALQLYSSYGHDAGEFISGLPAEYAPELVETLRLQGMETDKQMLAIARENRLEWDIEDDRLDNERADENAASQRAYRERRLSQFDEAERGRNQRGNRGRSGNRGGGKGPGSPAALYTDIMDKWRKGGTPNARELEFVKKYEARTGKTARRGRGSGGGTRPNEAVARGPNGEKLVVRNGRWVDANTGKPVQ